MNDFYTDFERLVRKGFYVYVESDDDNTNIELEARDSVDDTHIIRATYTPDGERIKYDETDLVRSIISLLNAR